MSICEELRKKAEQTYGEGVDRAIEIAASCLQLCADGLASFSESSENADYPTADTALLVACSAVSGGWNLIGSADRERFSERFKLFVSNVNTLCCDLPISLTVPGYAGIGRNLMPPMRISAFTKHLTCLIETLDENEKMAFIMLHYLMLYSVFEQWPQVDVLRDAYQAAVKASEPDDQGGTDTQSADPYDPPESGRSQSGMSSTYASPSGRSAALISRYEKNAKRRWLPLKLYLIITGLFVVFVYGMYFLTASPFEYGQAVVVKDISGNTLKLLPDSEPVELAFVGFTDYNGVVSLFYKTVVGVIIYRLAAILGAFILNSLYRRKNAKKAAALRAGAYVP